MFDSNGQFDEDQIDQLLRGINHVRVMELRGQSHLTQQDVLAHLTRLFGFGNWTIEVLSAEPIYEYEAEYTRERHGEQETKMGWNVGYRVVTRLTVRNREGRYVAHYEDGACGDSTNQPSRGDAHDLAFKTALSQAKKRCAIHLGDQFGLSLYNKGSKRPIVAGIVGRGAAKDIQDGVERQRADSDESVVTEPTSEQSERLAHTVGAEQEEQ